MAIINLNNLSIPSDDGKGGLLSDYSVSIENVRFDKVEAVFKGLENKLVSIIKEFENGAVFGCVAWLTSTPILNALAKCSNVQIIVQKEDFLRPDINAGTGWKTTLHRQYNALKCGMDRYEFRKPIQDLSVCADPTVDPVRCVGHHNAEKNAASPRAHHKFLVFCNITKADKEVRGYSPVKLWTGSYNMTKNATFSFENALILSDKSGTNPLINAYLQEHHQIFALSEQLDWQSAWTEPDFRIGS